jgi:hypothetical protein
MPDYAAVAYTSHKISILLVLFWCSPHFFQRLSHTLVESSWTVREDSGSSGRHSQLHSLWRSCPAVQANSKASNQRAGWEPHSSLTQLNHQSSIIIVSSTLTHIHTPCRHLWCWKELPHTHCNLRSRMQFAICMTFGKFWRFGAIKQELFTKHLVTVEEIAE